MIVSQTKQDTQPLKMLPGLNSRLELYDDRIVISRTDFFGNLLPDWVGAGDVILLNDIKSVFLSESRGVDSPWVLIVLKMHDGHRTLMAYQRHDQKLAREIKHFIDDYMDKRLKALLVIEL